MAEHPALLDAYPDVIQLPVEWGDMDALGHVNNTVPVRWFESGRIAYLHHAELGHLMLATKLGPILAAVHCHFRKQIEYPDTVHVGTRVLRLGRSSLTMHHAVFSEQHQAVAADGESVVVIFDYQAQRPVRIPPDIRQKIERLEGAPVDS
jgi:acyl-CoA thioester hydrolase